MTIPHYRPPVTNVCTHLSFVWLVPEFTSDPEKASTSFNIVIQPDANPDFQDLAKGAGGNYRYLHPHRGASQKITQVNLLRLDNPISDLPAGYNGKTSDINKDREGTYLYLIWKGEEA